MDSGILIILLIIYLINHNQTSSSQDPSPPASLPPASDPPVVVPPPVSPPSDPTPPPSVPPPPTLSNPQQWANQAKNYRNDNKQVGNEIPLINYYFPLMGQVGEEVKAQIKDSQKGVIPGIKYGLFQGWIDIGMPSGAQVKEDLGDSLRHLGADIRGGKMTFKF